MSLLSIATQAALNVGLPVPSRVIGAPGREWAEMLQMANETGDDLASRVQWGTLTQTALTTGGDMPADFDRLIDGICVWAGGKIVRSLTLSEWVNLPDATGTPRYFLLQGDHLTLWPAGTATIVYQSKNWAAGGRRFTSDDQVALIDEDLLAKGLIVRWRRQKGMPYADEEAEFEGALAFHARKNDRGRL